MDRSEVKVADQSGQPPSQTAKRKGKDREHLSILRRVRRLIEQSVPEGKNSRLLVGLSGGMDSAVLCHILCDWRDRGGPEILAAHIHHGTRGLESDRDAAMAEELARSNSVEFHVAHVNPMQASGLSEGALWDRRLEALEALAKKVGAHYVALAHHKDDQAETVLFRILGGADLKGLGGISVFRPPLWLHPLLTTSRAEIWAEVEACKIPYIEDSSNQESQYRRNYLRNKLIPMLEKEFNPRLAEHLCALGESAARATEFLEQEAGTWMDAARVEEFTYSADVLRKAPLVVRYQVLQRVYQDAKGAYGALQRKHLAAIDHLLTTDGNLRVIQLPERVMVARRENVLEFSRNV